MSEEKALEQLAQWSNEGVTREVRRRLLNAVGSFKHGVHKDATLYQRLFMLQQSLIDGLWWHGHRLPEIYKAVATTTDGSKVISDGYLFHKCLVNSCLQTVYTYLPEDDVRTVPTLDVWNSVVASIDNNLEYWRDSNSTAGACAAQEAAAS